jgi:hypothetical protein
VLSATIRDIAIIIIAVQSIIIGILIGVLIWQIWRLVKILQTEIKPIIDDTQATVNTVRGTATFVSDTVVEPVIRTNRSVARWTGMASALGSEFGRFRRSTRRRPPAPPDSQPGTSPGPQPPRPPSGPTPPSPSAS